MGGRVGGGAKWTGQLRDFRVSVKKATESS